MRGPRRQVTYLSDEARERISRANAARWQDPEYRAAQLARLQADRKKSGNMGGFKRGVPHKTDVREKIRQTLKKRWQDPEFRARHLPQILSLRPKATLPPKGTPERRQYDKVASILGAKAARSLQFKPAETEGAGRP